MTSFSAALQQLLTVLDRLEVPFLIGGSVASGTHGLPRQTNDVDIVADLTTDSATALCEALRGAFYADPEVIVHAVREALPFNVIHLAGAYKFDIFPVGEDRFARSELQRRVFTASGIPGLENVEFPVASAEDTILAKLVSFRKGGEVSDRQWHDVLGMIQVQAGRLDRGYLAKWAADLGVADLLQRVLE